MTIGNKPLGESVVAFHLAVDLIQSSVVSLKIDITFDTDGNKIHLPIAEVLLHAAVGKLAHLKQQRDWTPRNAVLLPSFLTESAILYEELEAGDLLKIFAFSVTEWAKEGETDSGEDEDNNEDRKGNVETED